MTHYVAGKSFMTLSSPIRDSPTHPVAFPTIHADGAAACQSHADRRADFGGIAAADASPLNASDLSFESLAVEFRGARHMRVSGTRLTC